MQAEDLSVRALVEGGRARLRSSARLAGTIERVHGDGSLSIELGGALDGYLHFVPAEHVEALTEAEYAEVVARAEP